MTILYWAALARGRGFRARQFDRAVELGLPIPHTGKGKRYGHYLRNPRCHGIYREEGRRRRTGDMEIDGVRVRGKLHRPPNSYDDIPNSGWQDRNWKRFRRTRWKG